MSISIIFARGILSEVQRRGLDGKALLARCNIEQSRLSDLRETMTSAETEQLTREAMALTGDLGLGLTVGQTAPESMMQVFGHLVLAQRTIRESFAMLERYTKLLADGMHWNLTERGELGVFSCEIGLTQGELARFGVEYALTMAARVGRHFVPKSAALHAVWLRYSAPSYAERYEAYFQCPVLFDQSENALLFELAYLDMPQFHADDTLRTVLGDMAEQLLKERGSSSNVTETVRRLLRQERDLSEMPTQSMARQLGVSSRALRRKLAAEGASLTALVSEARCRIACEELRRPEANIKEVAELLGFSEPSAFHRAFKRWTGMAPRAFMRKAQDGDLSSLSPGEPPQRGAEADNADAL